MSEWIKDHRWFSRIIKFFKKPIMESEEPINRKPTYISISGLSEEELNSLMKDVSNKMGIPIRRKNIMVFLGDLNKGDEVEIKLKNETYLKGKCVNANNNEITFEVGDKQYSFRAKMTINTVKN